MTILAWKPLLFTHNLPPVNPDELRGSGIIGRRNRLTINHAKIGESLIWVVQTTNTCFLAYECTLCIAYYTGFVF